MRDAQKSGIRFWVILIIHCIGWALTMWEILKIWDIITAYTSNSTLLLFSIVMMLAVMINLFFFGYIIDRIKKLYPIDDDLDEKLSDQLRDDYWIYELGDLFDYFNDLCKQDLVNSYTVSMTSEDNEIVVAINSDPTSHTVPDFYREIEYSFSKSFHSQSINTKLSLVRMLEAVDNFYDIYNKWYAI